MPPLQTISDAVDPDAANRARLDALVRRLPRRPSRRAGYIHGRVSAQVEALLMGERYEAAAIHATVAVREGDDDADAYVALAKAYLYQSMPFVASRVLRRAIKRGAEGPEVLYLQAVLCAAPREQMDLVLSACEASPDVYPEALLLAARLAASLRWGTVGSRLLRRLAPWMVASPQRLVYEREMGEDKTSEVMS